MARKKITQKEFSEKLDEVFLQQPEPRDSETVISTPADAPVLEIAAEPEAQIQAKVFVAELKKGTSPVRAAEEAGTTLERFTSSEEFRAAVVALVRRSNLPAEARKEVIRAFANELVMRASTSDDPKVLKIGLDAAKLIGSDPEVAITQPDGMGVVINLGALGTLIGNDTILSSGKNSNR